MMEKDGVDLLLLVGGDKGKVWSESEAPRLLRTAASLMGNADAGHV